MVKRKGLKPVPQALRHLAGQSYVLFEERVLKTVLYASGRPQIPAGVNAAAADIELDGEPLTLVFDDDIGWFGPVHHDTIVFSDNVDAAADEDTADDGTAENESVDDGSPKEQCIDIKFGDYNTVHAPFGGLIFNPALAQLVRTMACHETAEFTLPDERKITLKCVELYNRTRLPPLDLYDIVKTWPSFDTEKDEVTYLERCHDEEGRDVYDKDAFLFTPLSYHQDCRKCDLMSMATFSARIFSADGVEQLTDQRVTIGLGDINPWFEAAFGQSLLQSSCFLTLPFVDDPIEAARVEVCDDQFEDCAESASLGRYVENSSELKDNSGEFGVVGSSAQVRKFAKSWSGLVVRDLRISKIELLPHIQSEVFYDEDKCCYQLEAQLKHIECWKKFGNRLLVDGCYLHALRLYDVALNAAKSISTNATHEKVREMRLNELKRMLEMNQAICLARLGAWRHGFHILKHQLYPNAPEDPKVLLWLGRVERAMGMYDDARVHFKQGQQIQPTVQLWARELALTLQAEQSCPRSKLHNFFASASHEQHTPEVLQLNTADPHLIRALEKLGCTVSSSYS